MPVKSKQQMLDNFQAQLIQNAERVGLNDERVDLAVKLAANAINQHYPRCQVRPKPGNEL